MDANLICAMMNRALKVTNAYDYKVNCTATDACAVARVYFAQKFLDLGADCDENTILEKHVGCNRFPDAEPNVVVTESCAVTITETDPVSCRTVTITVVQ